MSAKPATFLLFLSFAWTVFQCFNKLWITSFFKYH